MSATKLTKEQALKIRELYSTYGDGGAGTRTLAARYGVGMSTIDSVLKGTHPHTRGLPNIAGTRGNSFRGSFAWTQRTESPRRRRAATGEPGGAP